MGAATPISRRAALAVPALGLSAVLGGWQVHRSRNVEVPLYASTVALADGQRRVLVPPEAVWTPPDSRILLSAARFTELSDSERTWVARATVPRGLDTANSAAVRLALLDLRVLTLPGGAAVAGWNSPWRYVWPRDAAFVSAAFSAYGYLSEAAAVLSFLQRVQGDDGRFQARYLADGSGRTPDTRGVQLDGCGWSLWGLRQWAHAWPSAQRADRIGPLRDLLRRSAAAAMRVTSAGSHLPPVSPDYWETKESDVTLASAASFLTALQCAAELYGWLGDHERRVALTSSAASYERVVVDAFAQNGFCRYRRGHELDAAVSFLLPPFVAHERADVTTAWMRAREELTRPAGGLAPGAGWKQDGISWTPQTALFAITAAHLGATGHAAAHLDWLLRHRTAAGSFPEKVISSGAPAAVAPLSWTCAAFLLARRR